MKTKLLNTFAAASAVLATLLGTASARAGTITVVNLPATGTDAATGITTNKHYVCAFDFGNNGTTPTINGVPFTHYTPPTGTSATNYVSTTDANFGGTVTLTTPELTDLSILRLIMWDEPAAAGKATWLAKPTATCLHCLPI